MGSERTRRRVVLGIGPSRALRHGLGPRAGVDGQLRVGERDCPAGTHIELPQGAVFGPLVAGPDGAVLFEVMLGDPRSWGDRPERFDAALAAAGAEALPDPPLAFPDWLVDLRQSWDADDAGTAD